MQSRAETPRAGQKTTSIAATSFWSRIAGGHPKSSRSPLAKYARSGRLPLVDLPAWDPDEDAAAS